MKNLLGRLLRDEGGQDMIEYALLGGLISIVAIATIKLLSALIDPIYVKIKDALTGV